MVKRLDNKVFFKKAFTDKIVFKAFVKDIIGIEVNTEKKEKFETARLIKQDVEPIEKIMKFTGLTQEEINAL